MPAIANQSTADCAGVVRSADICGGDACIEDTRMPVWLLFRLRQLGVTDHEILEEYPDLTPRDLQCAWAYVESHRPEIEQAVRRNGN
jgi:uncharacterized protein (DUF433 family)